MVTLSLKSKLTGNVTAAVFTGQMAFLSPNPQCQPPKDEGVPDCDLAAMMGHKQSNSALAIRIQESIPPVTVTVSLTWDSTLPQCCHGEPGTLSWQYFV